MRRLEGGKIMSRLIAIIVAGGAAALLAGCGSGPSTTQTYHATLSPAQEVPPTASSGTGAATITVDTAAKTATWNVTYSGLSGPAGAAHIHGPAGSGANAGVVMNLGGGGTASPITGSAPITDAQIADLAAGKYYINVHTAANKGGEIRGQITP
jgi:hypothetical protein